MRRLILSTVVKVVALTLAVGALPVVLVIAWFVVDEGTRPRAGVTLPQLLGVVLGLIGVLVVVALVVGFLMAGTVADRISGPLVQLAERAEKLGGEKEMARLQQSGIDEIDRLADVLARSAQQVNRNLAAEREFAGDASHQLRTPLTALLMRLEEICDTDDLDVVREEGGIAISQVERLTLVVDDLLSRTRTHTTSRPSVGVDTVLAAMQREWQPAFAGARRSIQVTGERGLVVRAAQTALAQIFSTLLENSLQHGVGTVRVSARRAGPSVVIEVSDQGKGIDPKIAPHIFERAVSSSGSGLGLTLARDLAESNGGRLELLSAQPAVFALFLSEAVSETRTAR